MISSSRCILSHGTSIFWRLLTGAVGKRTCSSWLEAWYPRGCPSNQVVTTVCSRGLLFWLRVSVEVCREADCGGLEGDTAMADLEKGVSTCCVTYCELYTVCKI